MQLQAIQLFLPNKTQKQKENAALLLQLCSSVSRLHDDLFPKSVFSLASVDCPEIAFDDLRISLVSGKKLGFADSQSHAFLPFDEVVSKLDGKLVELNHWGMNIGPSFMSKEKYIDFRTLLAGRCNLYRYPKGEEWPFVIPSTREEFKTDIIDTFRNRNPKFEIVYYEKQNRSLIQFDLETALTKEDVYQLFPDPYGVSFPGLEEFFRSVWVDVDWGGVECRIDIGFRKEKQDFGYWLIKEGGRISGGS